MGRPGKSGGVALSVKVVPGASRDRVVGAHGNGIRVTVTAPAEGGAANEAVVALLARVLGVARAGVRISRGHSGPHKQVLITGLGTDEVRSRLAGTDPSTA
ncbi:MAG: DUF167 domain-containing protein [Phycisphaerales bacterium]|nr:DUF167 domain-containing protein [Phycisphaerales bacterium]